MHSTIHPDRLGRIDPPSIASPQDQDRLRAMLKEALARAFEAVELAEDIEDALITAETRVAAGSLAPVEPACPFETAIDAFQVLATHLSRTMTIFDADQLTGLFARACRADKADRAALSGTWGLITDRAVDMATAMGRLNVDLEVAMRA